jgi:hypothetical protein
MGLKETIDYIKYQTGLTTFNYYFTVHFDKFKILQTNAPFVKT